MSASIHKVVGFGAGSLDLYRPVGVYYDHLHVPGGKGTWSPEDQALYERHLKEGSEELTEEIGGNVLNALVALATDPTRQVSFASILSAVGDPVSDKIRARLKLMGVIDASKIVEGHVASVGMVERSAPGADRMIRGLPRTNMLPGMTAEYIREVSEGAGIILVASLKDPQLNERVLATVPQDSDIFFNPGSSEYAKEKELEGTDLSLKRLMQRHDNIKLLAVNGQEIGELYNSDENPITLAERASDKNQDGLAHYVLCTLGKDGIVLAFEGQSIFYAGSQLGPEEVVDTLGAGDRANAIAIDGLIRGLPPEEILKNIAEHTARTIRVIGGHGDLAALKLAELKS